MTIYFRTCLLVILFLSLSACTYAPGVPALKISNTKSSQTVKEGLDYKLVRINANTLKNQKPFDYVKFIRLKKANQSILSTKQAESKNRNQTLNGKRQSGVFSKAKKQKQFNKNNSTELLFEGITEKDNKSNYKYYIGKGDVLGITVWDHPELTDPIKNNVYGGHLVGSNGGFNFPYVGSIYAAGKTTEMIREELKSKLAAFVTKPQISINILQYRSQKVFTSGAVVKPSSLIIDDVPTTVRDAISESGGVIPEKYTGFATLARKGENISIDLNRMLKYNDNRQNFILKNGDRLNIVERSELEEFNRKLNLEVFRENALSSVRLKNELKSIETLTPIKLQNELKKQRSVATLKKELERELRSEQVKVFVMGEIKKPGSIKYQVEDGMTLAEAINDAGSFKEETLNRKGIFVIRKESSADQIPTVYQLSLSSVHSMFLAEQFELRPRDIVYATATPSIRWNRLLAQIIPSLTLFRSTK